MPSSDPGYASELAYWDLELSLQGHYPEAILNRSDPARMIREFPPELPAHLDALRARFDGPPRVLDVGSGPLSMLAYGAQQGLCELVCADPLAAGYAGLRARHGYSIGYPQIACAAEQLSAHFPPCSFHLVWIHNALDHARHPGQAVREACAVLQPGGLLLIRTWSREGEAEGYVGLHQHDLYVDGPGRLLCQTAGVAAPYDVLEGLPLECIEVSAPTRAAKEWIRVTCRRLH
jgi:SAM-dependent methyltransferase